ncbi:coiled-coil domain-containing protein 107 [Indicator indicator]|uniref:coiled-coil domain-containing protein 107 n=1 Tax=Indicator indicator TaxID=1002788 RepID=UPI0023DFA7E2|nr:coiled-coil domain-containing protein 107 [Indicator indicator]
MSPVPLPCDRLWYLPSRSRFAVGRWGRPRRLPLSRAAWLGPHAVAGGWLDFAAVVVVDLHTLLHERLICYARDFAPPSSGVARGARLEALCCPEGRGTRGYTSLACGAAALWQGGGGPGAGPARKRWMFAGGGGGRAGRSQQAGKTVPGHYDPRQPRRGSPQTLQQLHMNLENSDSNTYQSIQQMRNAMEREIKSERTRGNGRELAFTLMPLYALGVGVFAAYKFLKMKSHEESLSKKEKSTEDKAKETEHQLLELEKHLAQTEKMLNSLLTQLDPLSNCVNALACEQKDEIMTQLQSIRRLMKESRLDKSDDKMKDVGHICNEKLEDLIQSFTEHSQEKDDREDDCNEDSCEEVDNDYKMEDHELCDECEVHQFEPDMVEDQEIINKDTTESEEVGLRRRNRYE